MFTQAQMNEFQSKLQETIHNAQQKATARAKEIEVEGRKILETLGDRAQAELEVLLSRAQVSTKEQVAQLGTELVRLGKKLQDLARAEKAAPGADVGGSGVQPPSDVQ